MPELPEVETIKSQLKKKIVGKSLNKVEITNVRRRAKILIIDFKDGSSLVFHLMLNGQIVLNGKPSKYTRKVFVLDDGTTLAFNDSRKFGWWKKVKSTKEIESKYGVEALDLDLKTLKDILSKRPLSKIKPLLLDQKAIAGIGNIYSDEILFAARINPLRRVKDINEKEVKQLLISIKKILKKAIETQGSSVKYYVDATGNKGSYVKYHKVYQRHGKECSRCKTKLERVKIASRSTHFCPKCQP